MIKRYSNTSRFRVIINDACFYTTAEKIRAGISDLVLCNSAVQQALDVLEVTRSGSGSAGQATTGISGRWEGLNVQLDFQQAV